MSQIMSQGGLVVINRASHLCDPGLTLVFRSVSLSLYWMNKVRIIIINISMLDSDCHPVPEYSAAYM